MSASPTRDPPTPEDERRLQRARALSRRRRLRADAVHLARREEAFQEELASTVRSVSSFLVTLVGEKVVDRAVGLLAPVPEGSGPFWKGRADAALGSHALRHRIAFGGADPDGATRAPGERARVVVTAVGVPVVVRVVGHAVETSVRLGGTFLDTRFGVLRIELGSGLPEAVLAALPGRPIETVVDHPALRGRGWVVGSVDDEDAPLVGPFLEVVTGSAPYLVPWAR